MTDLTVHPDNRFFRLPFLFDPVRLADDLLVCQQLDWPSHFNRADFSGRWTSIALRSASGSEIDIRAHPGEYADTPLLAKCPYFQTVLSQFQCQQESVRLLALAPGSVIHEHRDGNTSYEHGFFRLHVLIQTGSEVAFRVDGQALPMAEGECWYANFDLLHSVRNDGLTNRVHLVLDCRRNAWSDALFLKAGYDFAAEQRVHPHSLELTRQIMAELARHNTDTARRLMDKLSAGQTE
ncbi:aspartyl/asparaginyl beta-hydroxylase domain-containing protein [Spirosoma luteum]|uniref:aspartyl/asparaginyl beta-hydroxylase domain-containing protein n=1 Tax=Spirosoma luteum TaxID=431553 RepID=UPI00035C2B6E|nr:aspartyl/asparaginyl beta-hydroxylase domain-containing protein [Spirosoma luteum]